MASSSESPTDIAPARSPRKWYAIWLKAVSRPTVGNFRGLLAEPGVTFGRALKWVFLAAVTAGLVSWAVEPGFVNIDQASDVVSLSIGFDFSVALGAIVSFVFFVFLEHAIARAIGRQGSYVQLAYISATYVAVLTLIGGVLSGVDNSIIASVSSIQRSAPMGGSIIGSVGTSANWFWISTLLLLARFALDRVSLRAVYQLGPWESFLPILVCIMVAAGTACCFTLLVSFG